jgi:hypothetical protein
VDDLLIVILEPLPSSDANKSPIHFEKVDRIQSKRGFTLALIGIPLEVGVFLRVRFAGKGTRFLPSAVTG